MKTLRLKARIFFSGQYWRHERPFGKLTKNFFTVVGVLTTVFKGIDKLLSLVQPDDNWVQKVTIQHPWWTVVFVVVVAVFVAMAALSPTIRVSSKLNKRDLTISIELGDLFDTTDPMVIGTNCTFDTELRDDLISATSIQGQFTKRYYASPRDLDADIEAKLGHETFSNIPLEEKPLGKQKCYRIGAVAQVRSGGRTAYFLALANMNAHGVAQTNIDNVRNAMGSLWEFVSERGGGLPRLRVPVLGTGYGKLTTPRQEMVKEILRSVVAAATSNQFCESFTIVISINDYLTHKMDLAELGEFLRYQTSFTEIRAPNERGVGAALEMS